MGWLIKDTASEMMLMGVDSEGYGQFSANPNTQWWWSQQSDAEAFIAANNLTDVETEDAGSNPPGNGQPGQP
jgi:hypothetical protein